MSCIGLTQEGGRCNAPVSLHTNFCSSCAIISISHYIKYKKAEEKIGSYPSPSSHNKLLKYYARLNKAYRLRKIFREKFVHPSAWDEGHTHQLKSLNQKIEQCVSELKTLVDNSSNNKSEEENDDNEENEPQERSPYAYTEEELSPNNILPQPTSIDITTPLDNLSHVVGDRSFAHFLMTYLYSLFDRLIFMLGENAPFIMISPIFKFIRTNNTSPPYCDSDFVVIITKILMPLFFYFFDLFVIFQERSLLLYRFYRVNKETYAITFITNTVPYIVYVGIENKDVIFNIRRAPNKDYNDPFCLETGNTLYYNYHGRYNKDIHLMIDTKNQNKISHALYRIYENDMYERFKEKNYDDPWRRLYRKDLEIERKGKYALITNTIRVDHKRKVFIFG